MSLWYIHFAAHVRLPSLISFASNTDDVSVILVFISQWMSKRSALF